MQKRDDYIGFIKDQMAYYDKKSRIEKKRYYFLSITALAANAFVPILSTFSSIPIPYKQIIAILSGIAAICSGAQMVLNSEKNWLSYRNCQRDLETALRTYNTGVGDYLNRSEEEAFELLVAQCEAVISNERQAFEKGSAK